MGDKSVWFKLELESPSTDVNNMDLSLALKIRILIIKEKGEVISGRKRKKERKRRLEKARTGPSLVSHKTLLYPEADCEGDPPGARGAGT